MNPEFTMTDELESMLLVSQYLEMFFRLLRVNHDKLSKVLQSRPRVFETRPSIMAMVLGLQVILDDYQNVGSWYLDRPYDREHLIENLMKGTPHDDLTRDVDVHYKMIELAHPPTLSFNLMLRLKKIYLEADPQFFTKEQTMRNAHRILTYFREVSLVSQLEPQLKSEDGAHLNRLQQSLDKVCWIAFDYFCMN